MPDTRDMATVTYRVSDLLDQIKVAQAQGFARVEAILSTKADQSDVIRLNGRIDKHEKELGVLKQWQHDDEVTSMVQAEHRDHSWTWRRRIVAVIASIGMMVVTVAGPYLAIHLH